MHGVPGGNAVAPGRLGATAEPETRDHGLMLPILLYRIDPSGRPMLGPPREGSETEDFIRTAYQDIPLVVPAIREFWMPERVREANGQR